MAIFSRETKEALYKELTTKHNFDNYFTDKEYFEEDSDCVKDIIVETILEEEDNLFDYVYNKIKEEREQKQKNKDAEDAYKELLEAVKKYKAISPDTKISISTKNKTKNDDLITFPIWFFDF